MSGSSNGTSRCPHLVRVVLACIGALVIQGCVEEGAGAMPKPDSQGVRNSTPAPADPTGEDDDDDDDDDEVPLKEAKLNIEHNATDLDTGFQGAVDGEGWKRLDFTAPDGRSVLTIQGRGALRELGLTELFFETVEPENAEVPIEEILAVLPEGEYEVEGPTVDGLETEGTALLTHDIPSGPVLTSPGEGETVDPGNLVMSWEPVTRSITGEPINIIRYQLIVETDVEPHPHAIGKLGLSIYVGPSVTSITVPAEMLEPGTLYKWEVLAIEESGNQTLSSSEFETE